MKSCFRQQNILLICLNLSLGAAVDGTNYLTPVRNQHAPVYCGSCFAYGSTSSLADRLSIAIGPLSPRTILSTQSIISCGYEHGHTGNCDGGDDATVYAFAQKYGIPPEGCSNYLARNTRCLESLP